MIKRGFDILGATIALVVLSPLLAGVAAFVALRLGRPVLFAQDRAGRHGRAFRMRKFRTMTDARDAAGVLLPDAARLTTAGRFLDRQHEPGWAAPAADALPAAVLTRTGTTP
jgi:sugar transferase EpsL